MGLKIVIRKFHLERISGISRVFNSLRKGLEGQTIKSFTDCKNLKHIFEVGSKKKHLHEIAVDVRSLCICTNTNFNNHEVDP